MKATNTEKYIQKNNTVEAMQLTPKAYRDVPDFIGKNFVSFESGCGCKCDFVPISMYTREYIKIEILNPYTSINNVITLIWNDYIIKDQNGNISTIPKNIFEKEFQKINMKGISYMKKLICPACKAEIETLEEQQFKFCPNCGAKIEESEIPKEATLGDCILNCYMKNKGEKLYEDCIVVVKNTIEEDVKLVREHQNKCYAEHLMYAINRLNKLKAIDSDEFYNITKNKLLEILNINNPSKVDLNLVVDQIKFQASNIKKRADKSNG